MAGLNDISSSDPAGTEAPSFGDNRIRAIVAKLKEAFAVEHALTGVHGILSGSLAERPAFGNKGRLYILVTAGVATELQWDTGAAWANLTSNQTVVGYLDLLAVHIAANPIDHPVQSVTHTHIKSGDIKKKHLDGSADNTSIAALVNGANADAFHVHAAPVISDRTPDQLTDLATGWVVYGRAPTIKTISAGTYTKAKEIKVKRPGNFKISFTLSGGIGTATLYGKIYKNGVPVGTERAFDVYDGGPGGEIFTEDISSFVVDDLIQIYCKISGGCENPKIYDFEVMAQWDLETTLD